MKQEESELTERAWEELSTKLQQALRDRARRIKSSILLTQAHALEAPPARLFDVDLTRMDLGRWSQVVRAAVDGRLDARSGAGSAESAVPLWTLAPALFQLGLGGHLDRLVPLLKRRKYDRPSIDRLEEWLEDLPEESARRTTALIVVDSGDDRAARWSPSSRYGGILVGCEKDATRTRNLITQLLKPDDPAGPTPFLFLAAAQNEWPAAVLKQWNGQERWIFHLGDSPSSSYRSLRWPSSLDDAIQLAGKLARS